MRKLMRKPLSTRKLSQMMGSLRSIFFPHCFEEEDAEGPCLRKLDKVLRSQLEAVLPDNEAHSVCDTFISGIDQIRILLETDVDAIAHNDPAVTSREEIILCYPAVTVMLHYRVAHALYLLGVPIIPRMITEMAHSSTGIDIHPAAKIGKYFSIDHGTGIVIGATTIIGDHVMLYQGVTLGAKNFSYSEEGLPLDLPRHPILEDNVTVYSNASILGRVRIGHDTVVGGNVWLTSDVPPHSKILQSKAVLRPAFEDGAGI